MLEKLKKFNKKQKLGIFALSIILLLSIVSITGLLPLASLYGGDSSNIYGGQFTASETSQSGSITTSFPSCDVDHIDISITNKNGFTDSKTLWIKPIGTTLTNYQKKIELEYDSDMQPDFDDVRFFQNGVKLDYCIIEKVDSTSAIFYIKVPTIDENEGACIDIKYGNPNLVSESTTSIFEFYDDFDNLDAWSGDTSSFTVSNSEISVSTSDQFLYTTSYVFTDGIIESKYKFTDDSRCSIGGRYAPTGENEGYGDNIRYPNQDQQLFEYNSGSSTSHVATVTTSYSLDTWYTAKLLFVGSSLKFQAYDTAPVLTLTDSTHSSGKVFLRSNTIDSGTVVWDYILVRKAASIEPDYVILDSFTATNYKEITINPSADGTLYHYQVFLDDVAYESSMQTDFDDLRFTYDGKPIPHFIDSKIDSTSADIYVLVPVVDETTGATIKMHYGDATASSGSTGKTFSIYDNFNDNILDESLWYDGYPSVNTVTETGGQLRLDGSATDKIMSNFVFGKGYAIEADFSWDTTNADQAAVYMIDDDATVTAYTGLTSRNANDKIDYRLRVKDNNVEKKDANTIIPNGKRVLLTLSENGDTSHYYKNIGTTSWTSFNADSSITEDTTFRVQLSIGKQTDDSGALIAYIDNLILRKYTPNPPTSSIGAEQTSSISSITSDFTISCTGDSDYQTFGVETKEITLTPSDAISQFDISTTSLDYDFNAEIHYTGDVTINSQNATAGTMTFTFTPDVTIEEGYANAVFDEDIIIETPEISVTLDDVVVDAVFENNNTISIPLTNCDVTEHVVVVNIIESITPTTPSSGGGGGAASVTNTEEVIEENTTEMLSEESSEQAIDFNIFNSDISIIILFCLVALLFGYVFYDRIKR